MSALEDGASTAKKPEPKTLEVLIRVRVVGDEHGEVPDLQLITRSGTNVQILGLGRVDQEHLDAAWARFRARAVKWTANLAPHDFVLLDIIGYSNAADQAASATAPPLYQETAQRGGAPLPEKPAAP